MAALGRILQVIGWLWFLAGLASRFFEFGAIDVFPGLILVFVARVIRAQAARQTPDEDVVRGQPEPAPPPRVLNTERQPDQSAPPTSTPRPPESVPKPVVQPPPVKKHNELLQDIVLAGKEAAATATSAPAQPEGRREKSATVESEVKGKTPMSSAEMIAQARKRWDRK